MRKPELNWCISPTPGPTVPSWDHKPSHSFGVWPGRSQVDPSLLAFWLGPLPPLRRQK